MNERAVVFDEGGILSGIVSAPAECSCRTGVLIFNAGILHRVGPGQLHVKLARELAAAGFPVLRFDFSGIGESEGRSDTLSYEERTLVEARAAMDVLAELGAERFLVFGICSGADNGFRVALNDSRVVGGALVGFLTFQSWSYRVHRYAYQLLTPAFWRRAVRGNVDVASTMRNALKNLRRPAKRPESVDIGQFWRMPPRDKLIADFRTLVSRGVRLLLVYNEQSPGAFNYDKHLRGARNALGAESLVQVEVVGGSDHTFTSLPHQGRLVGLVVDWARRVEAGDV